MTGSFGTAPNYFIQEAKMTNDKNWYDKPMRIGAVQFAQRERMFEIPRILEEAGFNAEQLLHAVGEGVMGFFDEERDSESLKKYCEMSGRLGTKIILYFNAHMIERKTFEGEPEWAQRHKNGEAVRAYDTYILACVNSKWRNHFLHTLERTLDYGIDGVFLDGPIFTGNGCYCGQCRNMFYEKYGYGIEHAGPKDLREFKTGSITGFVRDAKETMTKKGAGKALYVNSTGLAPNITGCDIEGVYPYVDFLGTEGGFMFYTDPNRVSLWKCPQNAKYLESKAKGKPTVIFTAANHSPWARYIHTPQEARLILASTVANGANIWYGIHGPVGLLAMPGGKAAVEFIRFLSGNEEFYTGTRACPDMALVWSRSTVDAFPEDVEKTDFTNEESRRADYAYGNHSQEFQGFYDIMARSHLQFAVIDDPYVEADELQRFKAVVLPNVLCMSEQACEKIRRYVEGGGTLISTFAASMYDEVGSLREKPLLADVFGIERLNGVLKYKPGCGYMEIGGAGWLEEEVSSTLVAGYMKSLECLPSESVKVPAHMLKPMEGSYDAVPEEKYPGILVNRYGKGRSIYISGSLGETWQNFGLIDLKRTLQAVFKAYADRQLQVTDAFETVEVELREQPDQKRKLIHLVNFTGCMRRPIDEVIPCRNITLHLKTGSGIKRIHTLFNKQDLRFRGVNGGVEFTIPEVKEYELAVVEFGE